MDNSRSDIGLCSDKKIFEIDFNKYDFSDDSLQKMREDFSSVYAVTDDKYKEDEFSEALTTTISTAESISSKFSQYVADRLFSMFLCRRLLLW